MIKHTKRIVAGLLSAVLFTALLAGCSGGDKDTAANTSAQGQASGTAATSTAEELGYPIVDKPLTLKIWAPLNSNAAKVIANYGESEMYKELEKITGIHAEFIHPPVGQEKEAFNLMISTGDWPDIIDGAMGYYSGASVKANADGVTVRLNDLIDKYAPNYKKALEANPTAARDVKVDNGDMLAFYELRASSSATEGPIVRADLLKKYGIKDPVTIADWEEMLRTFKANGIKIPFTANNVFYMQDTLPGAFGVRYQFIQEDGKVIYGPIDSRWKDFLTTMRRWYAEGLLDPEFATNNSKTIDAKMTNGDSAALHGFASGNIGAYLTAMKSQNPEYDLKGLPYPVLKEGDEPNFAMHTGFVTTGNHATITTTSKHQVEAVRYLDYLYSDEGILLSQFGIKDVSYTMENGAPVIVPAIKDDPVGFSAALFKYARGSGQRPPSILHDAFAAQTRLYKQQDEAVALWSSVKNKNAMPVISLTPEESTGTAPKFTEIETYMKEMLVKFIMGNESLDKWDSYVDTIKKMGIDECIKVRQDALDRYNKR